jgi:hypothetical protein
VVIYPKIERIFRHHPEHHPVAEYAGLAEHTPHCNPAERSKLLAQELGKAVAGNHPQSLASIGAVRIGSQTGRRSPAVHGAEIPEDGGGVAYAAGFMIATALLHLAGISPGFLIRKAGEHYGSVVVRLVGGLATVAGVVLLVGVI